MSAPDPRPLDGLLVLDLSHAAAGPFCTMLLADFGARVIKIEKPGRGDGARHMSMTSEFSDPLVGGDYFLGLNRNKESLALDLSTDEGRAIFARLAKQADIVVENFRPGVMQRLGFGWDDLKKINDRLIYCDISAFGSTGPLATEPGMDIVVQARSGSVAITGEPGGAPVRPGISLSDLSCGLQAAIGVLLAIIARGDAASGQHVAVSLLDATLLMMSNYAVGLLNTDTQLEKVGSGHPQLAPYQAFASSDGWIFVGCGTNQLWIRLCALLELEDIVDDPRFATNALRARHRDELNRLLDPVFLQRSTDEWQEELHRSGIPSSPIVAPQDAFRQEQEYGSGIVQSVRHPRYGDLLVPGLSIHLDRTPGSVDTAPPILGEQSEAVLRGLLGLSDEDTALLVERGVIGGVEEAQ